VYCIQTAEDIGNFFLGPVATIFDPLWLYPIPMETPSAEGVKYTGGGKICDFQLKSQFILEKVRDRSMELAACF